MDSKFEKLVAQIIKECEADGEPVTREEAEEMAKMEIDSKKYCKHYEKSEKMVEKAKKSDNSEKSEKKHTVKVTDAKKTLFSAISGFLDEFCQENDAELTIVRENKLIEVKYSDYTFKIDIIQKRIEKK